MTTKRDEHSARALVPVRLRNKVEKAAHRAALADAVKPDARCDQTLPDAWNEYRAEWFESLEALEESEVSGVRAYFDAVYLRTWREHR